MYTTKKYIRKTDRGANTKKELSVHKSVARYLRADYPHVIFFSDWAAGAFLSPYQAAERKSLQSGSGFPDMMILAPSRGYHGLALELKREGTTVYVKTGQRKGKLSSNAQIQLEAVVLRRLNDDGYFARFAVGYDQAVKIIDWYFCRPENTSLF